MAKRKERICREAELYPAVKTWLESQGLKVYPEVVVYYRPIDVLGVSDREIVGVEMKTSLTKKVLYQATSLCLTCERAYIAVGTKPRSLEAAKGLGVGILSVLDGKVEVLLESALTISPNKYNQESVREKCSKLTGDGVGGLPCLDGKGPAQDCKRRVDEYLKKHPKTPWKELYEKVPNHYANYRSMQGALTIGIKRRAYFKKLRRQLKRQMRQKPRKSGTTWTKDVGSFLPGDV